MTNSVIIKEYNFENFTACFQIIAELVAHGINIRQNNSLTEQPEYINKVNQLTVNFSTKLIMRNIQTGSHTVMDVSKIKYNIEISDNYFTKESLVKP